MSSGTIYRELSDSEYTQFRKSLVKTKGGEAQRQFLEAVRDTDAFVDCLSAIPTVGAVDPALAPYPLTESEYKDPPADTERALYESWAGLMPAVACRSTFWGHLTLEHVKRRMVEASYLAADGGNLPSGAERIDFALQDKTPKAPQRVDACVRSVLRRFGGLPEVRGNRSVYVDCPFARAWWRERIVDQTSCGRPDRTSDVRSILRIHQTYWEKLVDRIVFRNSTFGSINIRNAFLRAVAQSVQSNRETHLATTGGLQRACRLATAYQGKLELSVLSDLELDSIMAAVVEAA